MTTPGVPNVRMSQAFNAEPTFTVNKIPDSFPDGTSNTIFFTEKYAQCGGYGSDWAADTYPGQPPAGRWSDPYAPIVCYFNTGLSTMFQP